MSNKTCSVNNIYQLEGRVPIAKAIPFGLQHILAMFVANLTPITIVAATAGLAQSEIAMLLQNAMFVAGIATLIQLYPMWKIGSGLPIVMGVSFTFVTVLSTIAVNYGYPTVIGAVLVGGIFEGTLGLFAKYWRKLISPIVAASVVTAIGFSLFSGVHFIEGNVQGKNYIDLQLMSNCKAMIMSNSAFCYLAALLNTKMKFVLNPTNREV